MFKNVASQKLVVFAFDSTTNLPKTGDAANITAYVSKDYGAVTVLGDTSATEMDATNAKGYYLFDLTQAETNGNALLFSAKSATANIVVIGAPAMVFTDPANYSALAIDGSGNLTGSIGSIAAGGITDGSFSTTAGPISKLGIVDQGTAQAATGTTLQLRAAAAFASNELVGSTVYIVSATTGAGQSRVITAYNGGTDTATVDTWTTTPTGTIVYQVFATPPSSSAGTISANVTQIAGQTASAAGAVTFPGTIASATNITAGTITTVSGNVNGSVASVIGAVGSVTGAVGSVTGAVGSVTGNVGGNVVGSTGSVTGAVGSVTGAVGSVTGAVGSVSAGGITAGSFAANAIDAAALATTAAAEIAASVGGRTLAELSGDPGTTPTADQAEMLTYMNIRNKRETTATTDKIFNNAGAAILTATVSDDTVTFTKAKYA